MRAHTHDYSSLAVCEHPQEVSLIFDEQPKTCGARASVDSSSSSPPTWNRRRLRLLSTRLRRVLIARKDTGEACTFAFKHNRRFGWQLSEKLYRFSSYCHRYAAAAVYSATHTPRRQDVSSRHSPDTRSPHGSYLHTHDYRQHQLLPRKLSSWQLNQRNHNNGTGSSGRCIVDSAPVI